MGKEEELQKALYKDILGCMNQTTQGLGDQYEDTKKLAGSMLYELLASELSRKMAKFVFEGFYETDKALHQERN